MPMRVIADDNGSEVVFTARRRPGMTDDEFKADGDAVAADLHAKMNRPVTCTGRQNRRLSGQMTINPDKRRQHYLVIRNC